MDHVPSRYLGPEVLPCCFSATQGKIKRIDTPTIVFQENPNQIFSWDETSLFDLINDKKWSPSITTILNTVSEQLAEKVFSKAKIKAFVKSEDAISAVLEGKIHALVESSPVPQFLAMKYPDQVDAPLSKPLLSYKTGMAVKKGEQEFLNYLNAWITAREAEGWLPAKHKYWFESLEWEKD